MTRERSQAYFLGGLILFLVLLCLLLDGCAGRGPSSTDRRVQNPEVHCAPLKYDGSYHEFCCEGSECIIVN